MEDCKWMTSNSERVWIWRQQQEWRGTGRGGGEDGCGLPGYDVMMMMS